MADPATSTVTTRRWLVRAGGLAAGAAVLAAAQPPRTAEAADGDTVQLGAENEAASTTTLTVGGQDGSTSPTLGLANANGPSLYLQPLSYEFVPTLELGQITNTELGPVIGVDTVVGQSTTFLATGIDLADLPTPYALPTPVRLLDTRRASGRTKILRSSADAFDSQHRLQPHAWLDLEVTVADDEFVIPSAWVNATAVEPRDAGYLTVYPPGDFPHTSTLHYPAKQTVANGAFAATGIVLGRYAVRIYSSSRTHLVVDLTGLTIKGTAPNPGATAAQAQAKAQAKTAGKGGSRTSRLRSTLVERVRSSLAR